MADARDTGTGAESLRLLRQTVGLNQRQAARVAGVSFSYMNQVENGRKVPTTDWLAKVTVALVAHFHERNNERAA